MQKKMHFAQGFSEDSPSLRFRVLTHFVLPCFLGGGAPGTCCLAAWGRQRTHTAATRVRLLLPLCSWLSAPAGPLHARTPSPRHWDKDAVPCWDSRLLQLGRPADMPSGHQLGQEGPRLPCPPAASGRLAEGPGLTSMASLVDHEHIGADANYPTDITL